MVKNKPNKKKMNPILWIIFAVIIPLVIVSVIAVFALSFVGIDVLDWAKEKGSTVPVVSSFIKTDEEKDIQLQLERTEEMVENQQEEIEALNSEIASLESINDQQEQEIVKLENKLQGDDDPSDPTSTQEAPSSLKQTAASFRKMDQKKAADIIQNLDEQNAIDILKELSNDIRGKILEEMEPKLAADLTERLME